jgi:hypothetical protein
MTDVPWRRTRHHGGDDGAGDAVAAARAEILLLREENARLKAAQHQRVDISRLLGRSRSLAADEIDRDSLGDDAEQLLVEGLVIRESLLEICQEIERAMVAFEARLHALAAVTAPGVRLPEPRTPTVEQTRGHGAALA